MRLQAFKILALLFLFFLVFLTDSRSSSSGDDSKAYWSWILQYLSETDEDLLNEKALEQSWNELDIETFPFNFNAPNLFPMLSSSSNSEEKSCAIFQDSQLWFGVVLTSGFCEEERRCDESMVLKYLVLE